jgi:acyl-coenzyme A synthetase/AMP-(fatty) acid ligase
VRLAARLHALGIGAGDRVGVRVPSGTADLLDAEGELVRWGEAGELVIGGVGLGRYLDEAKDEQKYAPVPRLGWPRGYRSGDLVRADQEGLLFLGRADDQVKLGGRRRHTVQRHALEAARRPDRPPGYAAGQLRARTRRDSASLIR